MKQSSLDSIDLSQVINRIYDNALSGSNAYGFLNNIRDAFALNICSLEFLHPDNPACNESAGPQPCEIASDDLMLVSCPQIEPVVRDEAILAYASYFHSIDPLRQFALKNGTTGFLNLQSKLFGKSIADSDYYRQFGKQTGSEHFYRSIVRLKNGASIAISLERERSQSAFSPYEQSMIQSIVPHLKNASIISRVVEASESNDEEILRAQQARNKCGFILDARGNVVSMNDNGRELTRAHYGPEVRDGKLWLCDPSAQRALEGFLGQKFNPMGSAKVPKLTEFRLRLSDFPIVLNCRAMKKGLDFSTQDRSWSFAVLEISSPWDRGWPAIRDTIHCENLTMREKQVAFSLMSHLSEVKAAEELSIGLNTLRTHRKRLYEKMDVDSRQMLMSSF